MQGVFVTTTSNARLSIGNFWLVDSGRLCVSLIRHAGRHTLCHGIPQPHLDALSIDVTGSISIAGQNIQDPRAGEAPNKKWKRRPKWRDRRPGSAGPGPDPMPGFGPIGKRTDGLEILKIVSLGRTISFHLRDQKCLRKARKKLTATMFMGIQYHLRLLAAAFLPT
jgi:hypothetical protein